MDKCNTCDAHLLALVTGFAAGMLLIEILLEAVFALPNLPHTVSLWNAVGQFVVCAFLPACIVRFQNLARRCSRASRQKSISLEADVPPAFDVEKAAKELHNHVDGSRWYEIMMAWLPYAVIGALQFSSSVFANHAVLYVDFTVKVVFKASKLLPTMVLATMMKNHRPFSKVEYMAALMICGGTALFSHGGTKHDRDGKPVGSILIGASLLACSVLAEGYVANLQQVVLKKCSSDDVMFRTNILGAVGGFILLLLSGNAQDLIQYAAIHPSVVPLLVGSHLCLGISVWCYIRLIKQVGSVFAISVSTLRKSATVLLSFLLFPGKVFGFVRAFGLIAVLAGVIVAEHASLSRKKRPWLDSESKPS